MNLLFLMYTFPDMEKSFNMFTSIVEEFKVNGHEVFVVAPSVNHCNTGVKLENGVHVLRVKTLPLKNIHHLLKGISNVLLPYQFSRAIKKHIINVDFDLIISPTPPVTMVDLVSVVKKKYKAKFYLMLRDIFPQNAVDLGIIKKDGIIHKYFRKKEVSLYQEADQVGCMSKGSIDYILKHNPHTPNEKLHVLENFQKLFDDFPRDRECVRREYNLTGKYIVVFGGNIGKPQQLENVLKLAQKCEKYDDVLFFILGEGLQVDNLVKKVKENKYTNIRIQSTLPKDEYQRLLSVCDVGLISLHHNFSVPNIPSKTLDYFNVGIPVLASIDKTTDYGELLDLTKAGLWCFAGEHDNFMSCFNKLYLNDTLRREMGGNGRKYFVENLLPERAYATIMSYFDK